MATNMFRRGGTLIGMIALVTAQACSTSSSGTIPAGANARHLRRIVAETRGTVTLYDDTFGDATPDGITTGPNGALWFTDDGNQVIGSITTAGAYALQEPITGQEVSTGITSGPGKKLWFTLGDESGGIGSITTFGDVQLFKDRGGEYTQGITVGPDGALWFAEENGTVGRMTPDGKVRHFAVASSDAELAGIVTGPDGNLWVTQYTVDFTFSDKVIRVTTKGKYTAFTVGEGSSYPGPDHICVGPDGALWFTLAAANAIGRLTTSGTYEQFPTGYEYAQPSGIAAGPDGALWFTDFSGRAGIGRMTTSGKVTIYKVTGNPQIRQITAGPDGAMWFTTVFSPSAIGRITTH
jgi:streptogramin lyase